ncbi:MAG: S49 family peptidase [Chloroflexi bacterium]|nr:MAG: S49 family peptidase [Chloroflexota bacterium]
MAQQESDMTENANGGARRLDPRGRPLDQYGRPLERRAENEASVLRRMVESMISFQNMQLRQQARETFWKNVRWIAVALGFAFMATVNLIGLKKISGVGEIATPTDGSYVSQVTIRGMIAPDKTASAKHLVELIKKAFEDQDSKGVVLRINSPGGTPVQASIVYHEILRQKEKHPDKKVIAIGDDLMASGAYYIAAAADEIYANENSIVGSIGVKMETYGAVDLARKLGIERRIITAGEHKVRMDPLMPLRPEDRQKMTSTLKKLHANFIAAVRKGRGKRLKGDDKELFSGDFWTAEDALKLGLIDGIDTPDGVLQKVFGVTEVREYAPQPGLLKRLISAALSTAGIETTGGVMLPY